MGNWKPSTKDTLGTRKNVLFKEVSFFSGVKVYTNSVLGPSSFLFVKVSLFQDALLKEVPLYSALALYLQAAGMVLCYLCAAYTCMH